MTVSDRADKHPERISGMFDAIAGRYDLLNHVLSAGVDRYWRACAIRSLRLTGREVVLDVCTGTADVAVSALRRGARRVVGVDFAHEMLKIGARKLQSLSLTGGLPLVRGDAMCLPLATGSVDACTIAFGIRNVFRPSEALRDVGRVLRPGGRLAILEFAMPTLPGVRQAYRWYFTHVLPRIGGLVSRHSDAYTYLPASVGAFATPAEFTGLLREAGFVEIKAVSLTLGIVYLYTGRRAGS
jgi:demethylmenaquinone methyltransferase/2-methoxy-6-polyprenyl-1,4-benzoquinol methylase